MKRLLAEARKRKQESVTVADPVKSDDYWQKSLPLSPAPSPPPSLSDTYRVGNLPTAYYIPNIITTNDERLIVDHLTNTVSPAQWTVVKGRSLICHGGT